MKVYREDIPEQLAETLVRNIIPMYAVDVETTGLDPLKDELKVVSLWDVVRKKGYYIQIKGKAENLSNVLAGNGIVTVFHHAMFDCKFIFNHLGAQVQNPYCTKILAKIYDPMREQGSQSLAPLLERHLGIHITKNASIQTGDWSQEPTQEMLEYAENDVKHLAKLHSALYEKLSVTQMNDYAAAREILPFLTYTGIKYNGGLYGY